jgi:23S rRNA (cytidine1920-2'-O)/16S rRNA (cytidine1409-2'-O)-methyltransferase
MKPATKQRIDQLLVDRGLVESRQKAQALIIAGDVLVDGQKAAKPGQAVSTEASLQVANKQRYVSRGGLKLEAALDHFHVDPAGKLCIDVGASTGGFTDCLLQRGAARVYAIDVGTNQLDWKLRSDPRVVAREQANARNLDASDFPERFHLAVFDVSFISVTMIVPAVVPLLVPEGEMIILVKPQFEVGKGEVGKGGIVRDPALHEAACRRVQAAVEELAFRTEIMESPILGAEGNREFLLYAHH